jgi:class 3 adenylate cyclase
MEFADLIGMKVFSKVFLGILFLSLIQCSSGELSSYNPTPNEEGILDLRNWNFETDGAVNLSHGYEFYWDALLVEAEKNKGPFVELGGECIFFPNQSNTKSDSCDGYRLSQRGIAIIHNLEPGLKVDTPHLWNEASEVNGKPISPRGKAIYKIQLNLPGKTLGIYNSNWVGNSSFRVWVYQNNKLTLISSIGNPWDESNVREVANGMSAIHTFEEGKASLIIEVANYNYKYGYLTNQLRLGSVESTIFLGKRYLITETFIAGLILMAGVYHIIMFILRRNLRSAFWFGMVCIMLSLRVAVVARLYQIFFPETDSYILMNRMEYLTFTLTPAVCATYLRYILNKNINYWFYRFIILHSAVTTVVVLTFPSFVFSQYLNLLQSGIILIIIFTLSELIPKTLSDKKKLRKIARSLVGVFAVYSICMVHDILMYQYHWKTFELSGLGLVLLVLGQSVVIARMNAEAWENSDRLTKDLEREVEIRTEQYKEQFNKSEKLLLNILPEKVAEELKQSGKTEPELFESVTVCFTDFVGFTQISEKMTPSELVAELDRCFSFFDGIIEHHKLEKLKTIGDSYMFAGGIPIQTSTHAIDCVLASLKIQDFMNKMKKEKQDLDQPYWELRLGINSGSLVAGVIGNKKFAYDIWSDTVNTASRCESSGTPGMINIGKSTYDLVKDFFECEYRGAISAKNKGDMDMYYVKGIKQDLLQNGSPNHEFWDRYEKVRQQGK